MLETSELSRIMSASTKFYPLGESRESVLLELSDNKHAALLQQGRLWEDLYVVIKDFING